jgi:methyl-accepting chemotaxis protein
MFKNLSIAKRLIFSFGVVLALVLITGIVGGGGAKRLSSMTSDILQGDVELLSHSNRLRSNMLELRRIEKDLLMTIEYPESVARYLGQWKEFYTSGIQRVELYEKQAVRPEDKKIVAEIKADYLLYCDTFLKVADGITSGRLTTTYDGMEAIMQIRPQMQRLNKNLHEHVKMIEAQVKQRTSQIAQLSKQIMFVTTLAVAIAFALALLLGIITVKGITGPLRQVNDMLADIASGEGDLTKRLTYVSSNEIGVICTNFNRFVDKLHGIISQASQSTEQVHGAAANMSSNAERIATSAEEVAAQAGTVAVASEEMAATSNDIASNCSMAVQIAQQAASATQNGFDVVKSTVTGILERGEGTRRNAKIVASLGERSDQIGAIVATIEDIADQTNLLALNAAIEAARAGEQGRGFAVVADEVRALAERTTRATKEIGEMIRAIQGETRQAIVSMEEGVKGTERGAAEAQQLEKSLMEILEQVNTVTLQISQIATAAEEQTATTNEITANIQRISETIQDTSQGAQETAGNAGSLTSLGDQLQHLMGQFKLS